MSIAWKVALEAHAQGAEIVLTNAPVAMRMGEIHNLAKLCGDAPCDPGGCFSEEDLQKLFEGAMEHFGGKVDFVLHNIGESQCPEGCHYTDLNYNFLQTTFDVSAISLYKTLATAKKLDALNEWGSVVALSYIAAQGRIFPDYGDMADAKSLLESITRSFGYHYGVAKKDPREHRQPITHGDDGGKRREGFRRVHQLQRSDVAAGECRCAIVRRVLHHAVQRFDALRYDAKPVPRRRVLQHGCLHGGHLEVWARRRITKRSDPRRAMFHGGHRGHVVFVL